MEDGIQYITGLVTTLIRNLYQPFALPQQRWFIGYVLTSLALAYLVYWMQARRDPELKKEGFFPFAFPKKVYGHPGFKTDLGMFFVNKGLLAGMFASLAVFGGVTASLIQSLLTSVATPGALGGYPVIATLTLTAVVVLAIDFGNWFSHYLGHRIPILWEFHKVHHSAEEMSPFTAARAHPVDDIIGFAISGICGGIAFGTMKFVFGADGILISLFGIHVAWFLFYVFGFHLRHSHVWLPYTGWLGHVLVSPAHHQLHHSLSVQHWDRNMGFVFAFWDRMAGTLVVPERDQKITFGLNGYEEREYDTVGKLLIRPFIGAWRVARGVDQPDYRSLAMAAQLRAAGRLAATSSSRSTEGVATPPARAPTIPRMPQACKVTAKLQ